VKRQPSQAAYDRQAKWTKF